MRLEIDRILAAVPSLIEGAPNWRTFGAAYPDTPYMCVWHHTGGAVSTKRPFPSYDIITFGRKGPNPVPPRLCNILIGWNGEVQPITAGQANHGGAGRASILPFVKAGQPVPIDLPTAGTASCRAVSMGVEVEHPGIAAVPWPDIVVETSIEVAALLSVHFGWNEYHHVEHKTWAPRRKTDRVFTTGLPSEVWWHREVAHRIAELGGQIAVNPRPVLHKGSTGVDVAYLQNVLKLTPNGYFGTATEAAVIRLQSANGLKVDGIVGPATWAVVRQPWA